MKKRFLLLLTALFVLISCVTVHAAVTAELYHSVLIGDESLDIELVALKSPNAYKRVGKSPDALVTVEDDGTGENCVYKIAANPEQSSQQLAVNLYTNAEGTKADPFIATNAPYQKFVAKVYLSNTIGTVQVFKFGRSWDSNTNTDTAGVYLSFGGAYYYDIASSSRVCFIEPGTLEAGKWYTIEAVYSQEATAETYMAASVYDENGMIIGSSPMTLVSTLKWNGAKVRYLRTYLTVSGINGEDYVLFDDIAIYRLSEIPLYSAPAAEYDAENASVTFTFEEEIDETVINASNINVIASNPAIDVAGKYTAEVAGNVITVDVSALPYGENFTISVLGYALDGKTECEITTPEDPFEQAIVGANFVQDGDNVIASVSLDNQSIFDKEYMFVVTSWNNKNQCVAIRAITGSIDAGTADAVELPAVPCKNTGDIIRISLVDNWLNMTPVGDVIEYTLGGE